MLADSATPPATTGDLLKLEKAHIDLGSVKIQMVLGACMIVVVCAATAWRQISGDFVSAVDKTLLEALSGNTTVWESLEPRPYEPYTYPVSPVWFLSKLLLLTVGAQAFHLVSTGIVALTCLLVSLITLEITGRYGNRLGAVAAIWAGLMFAVHPLHAAVANTVLAGGLLLAPTFYLGAFWAYLRFRLLRETAYLVGSISLCCLALLSDFRTMTLPAALLAAEWCLYRKQDLGRANSAIHSLKMISPYVVSAVILGLVEVLLPSVFPLSDVRLAADPLAVLWNHVPDLLAFQFGSGTLNWAPPVLMLAYAVCLVVLIVRISLRSVPAGPFLLGCSLIVILSSPMLLSWKATIPLLERHAVLYLATAPVCILLALAALPAVDAISRRHARWVSLGGAVALCTVFAAWSGLVLAEVDKLL